MDGIIAYILSKKYVNNTVIGMGAIKGAACQVQSINKVGKTTTITLKWEDNVGGIHTQAFDIEDGLDGVSVSNATIKSNGHLELTLSNGTTIDCGKVLPQYDTIPTPSSSNEGQILQYIGTTTSNYTNGYFYECINDGGTYKWEEKLVQDSYTKIEIGDLSNLPDNTKNVVENIVDINNKIDDKENIFRYNVIPTASVDISGAIIQYLGASNATYTNGYYYQCVESPVGSGTYVWVQKNVQPNNGGGGGDGVVDGYYNSADQLFYEDSAFLNPITGEDNTIYVDLNTNGLYRYDGTIFIKVSSSTDSYTKAEIGDLSDLPDTSKNVIENIDLLSDDIELLNGSILTIKTDITQLQGSLANKVDKITGKGLSTNDYTNDDKEKLINLSPIYLIGSGLNLDSVTGELTASGIDVPIDSELSDTSINPVQNKVITTKIEQLEASKLSLSDVDNALSGSSINPVQNQVITLAIDQLQGSVLNKIQKMLGAQVDNFTVIDNNGGVKDSGISKDVVPLTASPSNKLLVASDLSDKADKVSGATNDDIALLDNTGNLKDSNKKLSDYQEKLTDGNGINIDASNNISLDITYLTASRVGYIPATEKGSNNGVAELDNAGKVPSSQLPSYVDDVIEGYLDSGNFYKDAGHTQLITPEDGKIYVNLADNTTYRWGGTAYMQISSSLALGTTHTTAYYGDLGQTAYNHSQITNGTNPHNTTADNVNLKVPIPALSGSKLDVESTLYGINTELGKKADKVASATNGHLAGLDGNGNLTDSGVVANDVIQKVATATGLLKDDGTVDTTEYQPKTLAVPIETLSGSQLTVETALNGINNDVVKTFIGTQSQWDALSLADKQKYEICNITDDGSTDNVYTVGEVDALLNKKLSYADNGILGAKNLLEVVSNTQTISGVTFTVNADKSITVNGTATANTSYVLKTKTPLTAGNTYIISRGIAGNNNFQFVATAWNSGTYIKNIVEVGAGGYTEKPFTPDYNGYNDVQISIFVRSGTTLSNAMVYPMIRLASDSDDTYQPYSMTNKELTELAEIKTYRDATTGVRFVKFGRVATVTFEQTANYLWNVAEGGILIPFPSGFELANDLGTISWREPLNDKRLGLSNTSSLKGIIAMEAIENLRLRGGFTYITD